MYFEWGTENDLGMIPREGMSENDRLESEKKKKTDGVKRRYKMEN